MRDCETILDEKRQYFEAYLQTLPVMEEDPLRDAITYSLHNGGKCLRPVLFLLTAAMYRDDTDVLLPFAAAIEMIHTYSLIHDDLPAMDDDDYRRGRLTCHKRHGEAMAILAGDGLLTEAFRMMASVKTAVASERLLEAIEDVGWQAGLGGMVFGQSLDIVGATDLASLKRIHELKTGALIRASLTNGAYLAGASTVDVKALDRYGYYFGLVFQITDDILDQQGSFEQLGKPIGSDEAQKKVTYCSLLGPERAFEEAKAAASSAIKALEPVERDTATLEELVLSLLQRKK